MALKNLSARVRQEFALLYAEVDDKKDEDFNGDKEGLNDEEQEDFISLDVMKKLNFWLLALISSWKSMTLILCLHM